MIQATPEVVLPHVEPHRQPLSLLQSLRAARRNVLEIIPEIAYRQPIVSGRLGGSRWHMVQEPAALRRVFLDKVDGYPKSEVMLRMLRPAVGASLFTSEGADWRWQRRSVAPVFAQRNVVALAPAMTATAERASRRLRAAPGEVEIVGEMLSATFDVICEVALSGRAHFDAAAYSAAVVRYFETAGKASLLDFLRVPHWIPRPGELRGKGAVRVMHAMVTRAIEARRREATGEADDLLDRMLDAEDPETGRRMSPTDVLHNMQFFIVAGHETTALALSWSMMLLALHPQIQEQARQQAREVIGDGAATAADLEAIPLVAQVLEEAMRLYPPVGLVARDVREADSLAGRRLLPGDVLFLPIYALHRHKLWWDEPHAFRPERFAAAAKPRDRFQYLPFGAGPRVCVGANFAMLQAGIILATLLARFRFTTDPSRLPTPTMAMTVRPDRGIRLEARPLV
jgi:cytochrome P450